MPQKQKKTSPRLPREVVRVLRQARENHSPWLTLEEFGLDELPEEVFALTELKTIKLSGNAFRSIPERLWDLPKLRFVNLTGNPIESLPDRPGLSIDIPIYRRCRNQIDAKNITLVIGGDTAQEDAEAFCADSMKDARGPGRLIIGKDVISIGHSH